MLLPEERLHLVAYLVATWFLALAAFGVGRATADPVATEYIVERDRSAYEAKDEAEPADATVDEEPRVEARATDATVNELFDEKEWDAIIERCKPVEMRWSRPCESVDLRLVQALSKDEELGSRLEAIDYLAQRGLEFAARHPSEPMAANLSFTQSEASEVIAFCALARQTQDEACRGLEWLMATALFASGDVVGIPEAYARMRRIGVTPFATDRDSFYPKARKAFMDGELKKSVITCEHGVEHGEERCVSLLAIAHARLGDRGTACEIFAGVPDSELPFRCGRSLVTRQVIKKKMEAFVNESKTISCGKSVKDLQ